MNPTIRCPEPDQLVSLLDDTLPVDPQVTLHVETCLLCQQRLDRITESEELTAYKRHYQESLQATRALSPPIRNGDLGSLDGLAIQSQIGVGGMGVVYKAWDCSLKRPVAIKILHRWGSADAEARFIRESQAMARLQHDHVVAVLTSGRTQDGTPYLVMPLIEGSSLKQRLAASPIPLHEAAGFICQVARGLQAAHQADLIHRDIKPENILLDHNDGRAKLTDFGLVRAAGDATLTRTDVVAGTPAYMSPEQISHPLSRDPRGDVYSLGITLYECLTGSPPFSGQPLQILEQHLHVEPLRPSRLNDRVPRDLENICLLAIAKDPARRYQTSAQFADDLQRFLDGRPVRAREATLLQRALMWRSRNRALSTSLGLLLVTLVAGIIGTSVMWFRNAWNAAAAQQYAGELEVSRDRLRQSVSRFQKRVFADEAMHLQMTDDFRSEMFSDVLSYLDEFAAHDAPRVAGQSEEDGLTEDYLAIGRAALDVGQVDEALAAADRALQRTQVLTADATASLDMLYLHFRAARLAWEARVPRPAFWEVAPIQPRSSAEQADVVRLAEICQRTCGRAIDGGAEGWEWKLAIAESDFMLAASRVESNAAALLKIQATHDELSTEDPDLPRQARLDANRLALKLGWFLAQNVASEQAMNILARDLRQMQRQRDFLRLLELPFAESDWETASMHARCGVLLKADGDLQSALEHAQAAEKSFTLALEQQPQNRIWKNQSSLLQVLLCDCLFELDQLSSANRILESAIKNSLSLSKSNPSDLALRQRIVKLFVKLADMTAALDMPAKARQEYFIAAQDCRLLFEYDQIRPWAIRIRPWLISKVLEQLALAPDDVFRNNVLQGEDALSLYLENKYGADCQFLRDVLEGQHQPERPSDLEFLAITQDLFSANSRQ